MTITLTEQRLGFMQVSVVQITRQAMIGEGRRDSPLLRPARETRRVSQNPNLPFPFAFHFGLDLSAVSFRFVSFRYVSHVPSPGQFLNKHINFHSVPTLLGQHTLSFRKRGFFFFFPVNTPYFPSYTFFPPVSTSCSQKHLSTTPFSHLLYVLIPFSSPALFRVECHRTPLTPIGLSFPNEIFKRSSFF